MAEQTDSAHERIFALESSTALPPVAVMRLLSRYERQELASFIAVAIDLLDIADGDPDLEGSCDEDEISTDFVLVPTNAGAGCTISDAGGQEANEDEPGLGKHYDPSGPGCPISDPAELAGDETDHSYAEDDFCNHGGSGPGCPIADNGLADTGGLYEAQGCDTDEVIPGGGSGDC